MGKGAAAKRRRRRTSSQMVSRDMKCELTWPFRSDTDRTPRQMGRYDKLEYEGPTVGPAKMIRDARNQTIAHLLVKQPKMRK